MTKKKLAVINLGAHGHINPTLPVVQELTRRGLEVIYFATTEFESAVKATGARFFSYDSLFMRQSGNVAKDAASDPENMAARFPLRLIEEAKYVLPQILPVLSAEKPDAIWYDNMALAARFAADKLMLPALMSRPSYAANENFSLGKMIATISENHPARRDFRSIAQAISKDFGVAEVSVEGLFTHAEPLNIVFMPRSFHPAGETFDHRFAFVGPSIAPRQTMGTFHLPANGLPLLFISLGTVFNDWPEFFSMSLEAFGSGNYNVVMAIGHNVDRSSLGPIPANFIIESHVPQLEVLRHAQAFITHGGMNSTQESLYYGVPLVVIPQMMEQAATARRVEELKVGKAFLDRSQVTIATLRAAVHAIIHEPSFKENVGKIQRESAAAGGFLRAADLILEHI